MKRKMRISEQRINRIVNKSVRRALNEAERLGWSDEVYGMLEQLKEYYSGHEGDLINRICGRIDERTLSEILRGLLDEDEFYDN